MAFRTFVNFKALSTTVPQPLIGSYITAGIGAPSNVPITLTLGAVSSAGNDATNIFVKGEYAWLINPDGTGGEKAWISGVSGNTVTLGSQTQYAIGDSGLSPVTQRTHVSGAFGTGTFIALYYDFNNLFVEFEDGGTGTFLYLGNAYNMTAAYRRIAKLAKTSSGAMPSSYSVTQTSPGNPFQTSELWVLGTAANDLYNANICIA